MTIKVKRFGENGPDQWYENSEGRHKCNEFIIDAMWWQWVVRVDVDRADDGHYTIFEFPEETFIEIPANQEQTNFQK